jgi:serine/threonine-protein kinase
VTDTLAAALGRGYRVERELGQGGMATVYLAYDLKHERRVAVKVLRPDLATQRFLREIKTIATLQDPHILELIDSGEVGATAYCVMPFVDGKSRRDRLHFPQGDASNELRVVPTWDAVVRARMAAGP